jgi:hypothetical protein
MRVKDVQIADLSEQNKALNNLHLKLTGQIVQQADKIQSLLRLTAGRTESNPATAADAPSVGKEFGDPHVGDPLAAAA